MKIMTDVLVSFSGGFGDILWSLPTVREISKKHDCKVTMQIMPMYASLLPLLNAQPYIRIAFSNEHWVCTGSPHGDQPWEAPVVGLTWSNDKQEHVEKNWEAVYHLTYRRHPLPTEPLIDFIAAQQGITLPEPVCPFIDTDDALCFYGTNESFKGERLFLHVAYAFNPMYSELKNQMLELVKQSCKDMHVAMVDVSKISWERVASVVKNALCFVGCRSSNYVLAHGVGQKNIFTYDPHPNRNAIGLFGRTFGNPHWPETACGLEIGPQEAARNVSVLISEWKKEKENAILETKPR